MVKKKIDYRKCFSFDKDNIIDDLNILKRISTIHLYGMYFMLLKLFVFLSFFINSYIKVMWLQYIAVFHKCQNLPAIDDMFVADMAL